MGHALKKQESDSLIESVMVDRLPNKNFRLSRPVKADVTYDESGYVIADPITGVFAHHSRLEDAIVDFGHSLVNEYEFLMSHQNNLSPALQREFAVLKTLIVPCS